MSALLAATALGGSAIRGKRGRDQEDEAQKNQDRAVGELKDSKKYIDEFSNLANSFAKLGQDSYDKYSDMVGGVETVLGDYYMGLEPDKYAAQANQVAQQQYQHSMDNFNDQLVAQGIAPNTTGISLQANMQMGNQMAQTKAQNVLDAPETVANEQMKWLGYTSGQQDDAQSFMGQGVNYQQNASNMYQQNASNIANAYTGNSAQQAQMAQDNQKQSNMLLGTGLYFGEQAGWF